MAGLSDRRLSRFDNSVDEPNESGAGVIHTIGMNRRGVRTNPTFGRFAIEQFDGYFVRERRPGGPWVLALGLLNTRKSSRQ